MYSNSMKSTSETYFIKDGFAPTTVPVQLLEMNSGNSQLQAMTCS